MPVVQSSPHVTLLLLKPSWTQLVVLFLATGLAGSPFAYRSKSGSLALRPGTDFSLQPQSSCLFLLNSGLETSHLCQNMAALVTSSPPWAYVPFWLCFWFCPPALSGHQLLWNFRAQGEPEPWSPGTSALPCCDTGTWCCPLLCSPGQDLLLPFPFYNLYVNSVLSTLKSPRVSNRWVSGGLSRDAQIASLLGLWNFLPHRPVFDLQQIYYQGRWCYSYFRNCRMDLEFKLLGGGQEQSLCGQCQPSVPPLFPKCSKCYDSHIHWFSHSWSRKDTCK